MEETGTSCNKPARKEGLTLRLIKAKNEYGNKMVINLEHVALAAYQPVPPESESETRLFIELVGGRDISLAGEEAERVWDVISGLASDE